MAFVNLVKEGKQKNKKVIISGCVPQADRSIDVLKNLSTIGTHQIERVVEVVEETLKGNTIQIYETKNNPSLILPKVRKNEKVEILIISSGCLGKCTFCKTRFARGTLKSYPPEMILNRVKEIVKEGIVSEIWISSEDTGAYGQDIGTNLPALLKEIIKLLPENMMLRVGMTNPPYIAKYKKEIAEILNNQRVFSFLHIPVQSGSDHVLELMNRQYKIELFRDLVDYMISQVRGVTIATDIICGFSGETEEDHKESVNLLKEYEFPIVNISQYYPRKGTPGALMKRVDRKIVKERSREISALFNKYEPYKGLLHKYINVFISNEIDGKHNVCHTKSYIKVLVDMNEENKVGSWIKVYVTETSRFHVVGKKVDKADTKYVIHHLMVLIALSLLVLSLVVLRKFVRE